MLGPWLISPANQASSWGRDGIGESRQLPLPASGIGAFAELIQAIDDGIEAVERNPGRSFEVRSGTRLHQGIGGARVR
ncbi:MAG: hypothetical protein M3Q53_06825, partial [Actinomycetota bacterium]|nr:hypothetical protein [Actinomycetota bacterium]